MLTLCALAAIILVSSLPAVTRPAVAQPARTMSSWVSPQHHLSSVVLQGWANEVEKATNGRVKLTMDPSAPPGTFDAVRDGLVDVSYVTASHTGVARPAAHAGATRVDRDSADQLGCLFTDPLEVSPAGRRVQG